MKEMSPELVRALESIAELRGLPLEEVCAPIGLRGKKEIVVGWKRVPDHQKPITYLNP